MIPDYFETGRFNYSLDYIHLIDVMRGHNSNMVDISDRKREVYRLRSRLIISIALLLIVAGTIIILLLSCYGS